jgi:LmbE family N-acetylglucosaminyl deacetylase
MYANDFLVPSKSIKDFKKVIVVFPHADDEAFTSGGTITELVKNGSDVTMVVMTKGERGTSDAHIDESLADIRVKEAENAAKAYGVQHLIQRNFPDNGMEDHKEEVKDDLKKIMDDIQPDLIITYDLAGLYGHPDHIVVSEAITELVQSDFPETKLWYSSFPKHILDTMKLPEHMAKDPEFKKRRVSPNVRVFVVASTLDKIKAVYAYQSQMESLKEGFPVKWVPIWFYGSLAPIEYFHEV